MNVIFLDTETTGLAADSKLVQLGYKFPNTEDGINLLFKPPVEISYGSMAVHHITAEMVADKESFVGSETKKDLEKVLEENILVAHNAPYDINILKNESVTVNKFIDTLSVARHLVDSPEHKLQYLRYFLKLNVKADAHDAWGDILVLEKLFDYLVDLIKNKFSLNEDVQILDKMIELTTMPVLLSEFSFGKYRGSAFAAIAESDSGYLNWLYNSETQKKEIDQNRDLVYTLKNYLKI
jgi:exodeoxyribonuclease X